MAITLMGGLLVATILTLLFLPALYASWFRVRKPESDAKPAPGTTQLAVPTIKSRHQQGVLVAGE